jgi:hypothetical protein
MSSSGNRGRNAASQRIHRVTAGKHFALGPRVAVLLTFSLLDAQGHPLAVDVADLQGNDFTHAKLISPINSGRLRITSKKNAIT